MRTHLVSRSALATGLVVSLVLVLAAACETSGSGVRTPGLVRGTASPISELFPPAEPRPALQVSTSPVSPVPTRSGSAHTVAAGENIYDIARQYQVDAYAIAVANNLQPPFELNAGQVVMIPGIGAPPSGTQAASAPSEDERSAVLRAFEPAAGRPASVPPQNKSDSDASSSSGGFIWPVSGRVVSTFGSKGGGRYNDGINIAAPEGTVVRAAESGVVAYAGNELRGFGRTLLIKHPGGWVTAYAHNSELLVHRGEQVRRGQAVARVGTTGGVDEPQLHFEIRRSRKAIDPITLLPQSGATARHGRTEG